MVFNYQVIGFFPPANQTVYIDRTSLCGGTLITRDIVLTAAHCIPDTIDIEYNGKIYPIQVQVNWLKPTIASMVTVFLGLHYFSDVYDNTYTKYGAIRMTLSNVTKVITNHLV